MILGGEDNAFDLDQPLGSTTAPLALPLPSGPQYKLR
jgi:hypothetical protein